jgi:hypothetical protein
MITEWPDNEPPKLAFLIALSAINRDNASTTNDESIIAPSTIASGERFAIAAQRSWYSSFLSGFSSTILIDDDPTSQPTTCLFLLPNTVVHL